MHNSSVLPQRGMIQQKINNLKSFRLILRSRGWSSDPRDCIIKKQRGELSPTISSLFDDLWPRRSYIASKMTVSSGLLVGFGLCWKWNMKTRSLWKDCCFNNPLTWKWENTEGIIPSLEGEGLDECFRNFEGICWDWPDVWRSNLTNYLLMYTIKFNSSLRALGSLRWEEWSDELEIRRRVDPLCNAAVQILIF